jgi:predicted MPP superfamily phosphohydrolase
MPFLSHNNLHIQEQAVAFPNLPNAFDGLRIVQISDLHFYEYTNAAYYERVLEAVHAAEPDLIMMTGDAIHYGSDYVSTVGRFLSRLNAKMGKFAVLGNHDYNDGAYSHNIRQMLSASGFRLLVNESLSLACPDLEASKQEENERLYIAGLDDLWYGIPDIEAALADVPERAATLILIHNPLLFDPIALAFPQRVGLVLAGHTHAGHVYIPFLGPIYRKIFRMKFRYGLFNKNGCQLYVSSGVGSAAFYLKKQKLGFPRFRFNTRPEIACLTLKKAF